MLLRSVSVGLLGASLYFAVGAVRDVRQESRQSTPLVATSTPREGVCVVDVTEAATSPELLGAVLRLAADERIVAVNDVPVTSDLAAGAAIAATRRAPGDYLDLTVTAPSRGDRRILVLVH